MDTESRRRDDEAQAEYLRKWAGEKEQKRQRKLERKRQRRIHLDTARVMFKIAIKRVILAFKVK